MKYILAVAKDGEDLSWRIDAPRKCFIHVRSSARQAARLVLEAIPDLLLTQHTLPDGSGLMVVESLRSHQVGRRIPVVVLGAEDLLPYQRLGCSRFLPATPQTSDLNRVLSELLWKPDSTRVSDPPGFPGQTRKVDSA